MKNSKNSISVTILLDLYMSLICTIVLLFNFAPQLLHCFSCGEMILLHFGHLSTDILYDLILYLFIFFIFVKFPNFK